MSEFIPIAEMIFNKNLMILEDLSDQRFDYVEIMNFDQQTGQIAISEMRQFFREHYHISDVMRIIKRIIDRVLPDVDFIPYRRNDTINEGSLVKNTITYYIDTMKPAVISQDGTNRLETGPRYRYSIRINRDDNLVYDVKAQMVDNYVRFSFYGKSRTEELELCELFRHLMYVFGGTIQNLGVPVLRFIQGGLENMEPMNNVAKYTPMFLDYLMRTEDLYVTHADLIKYISLEVLTE